MSEKPASMRAAERLEDSYKNTYEEIADVRRSLKAVEGEKARDEQQMGALPDVDEALQDDDPAEERGQEAAARVEQFKAMLADRRKSALAAFQADDSDRVEKLKTMLAECRTPAPKGLSATAFVAATPEASPASSVLDGQTTPRGSVFERLMTAGMSTRAKLEQQRQQSKETKSKGATPQINAKSQNLQREGAVEDRLQKRNQEYQAHITELRRQKENEELQMLKEPKITKSAKTMNRSGNVGERLLEYGKLKQEKKQQLCKEMEEKQVAEMQAQPTINASSRNLDRNVECFMAWEARKKLKLQQQRELKKNQELQQVKTGPTIGKNSARIVRNMNRAGRIEDQLLSQGAMAQQKKNDQKAKKQVDQKEMARPKISIHSAAIERKGDVCDRLYNIAVEKNNKSNVRVVQQEYEEQAVVRSDARQPKINKRSKDMVRKERIEDRLHKTGEEYQKRRAKRESVLKAKEGSSDSTGRNMGPYSQLLVELMEKRTNVSTQERLQKPTRQLRRSTLQDLEEEEMNLTFRPTLNHNSRAIDHFSNAEYQQPGSSRRDLLFQRAEQYEFKKARLQEEYLKQEMDECTFNPVIPEPNRSRRGAPHTVEATGDVAHRNMEWLKMRERSRELTRQKKDRLEMDECTFTPNLQMNERIPSKQRSGSAPRKRPPQEASTPQRNSVGQRPASVGRARPKSRAAARSPSSPAEQQRPQSAPGRAREKARGRQELQVPPEFKEDDYEGGYDEEDYEGGYDEEDFREWNGPDDQGESDEELYRTQIREAWGESSEGYMDDGLGRQMSEERRMSPGDEEDSLVVSSPEPSPVRRGGHQQDIEELDVEAEQWMRRVQTSAGYAARDH